MIKCPNCGSTAHPKLINHPIISDDGKILTESFECGCGCYFSAEYKRNDSGVWEHCWTFCDYIERK